MGLGTLGLSLFMLFTCSENSYIRYKLPAFYPIFSFSTPTILLRYWRQALPALPSLSMFSSSPLTCLQEVGFFYSTWLAVGLLFPSPFIAFMPPCAPALLFDAPLRPGKRDWK